MIIGSCFCVTLLLVLLGCGGAAQSGGVALDSEEADHQYTTTIFASADLGTGDHHLGRPFNAHFQPLSAAEGGTLFPESKRLVHSPANAMEHQRFVVSNYHELAANAKAWGIASGQLSDAAKNRYAAYRAYQITAVRELDDTTRMRQAPSGALYYLWRIHYGRLYEVVLFSSSERFHAGAKTEFLGFGGSIDFVRAKYRLAQRVRGRGLKPVGEALFATTTTQIQSTYTSDPNYSEPVPIFVEYKRVPNAQLPRPTSFSWVEMDKNILPKIVRSQDIVGTWKVSMTATYSTCNNMSIGDQRNVTWKVSFDEGFFSVNVIEGAQSADNTNYKGWLDAPYVRFKKGNAIGIELQMTGANELTGRRVVANSEPCAIVYDVHAAKVPDEF